jgi:hypothetical protein
MRKCYGIDPGLFIPEDACKQLIIDHIKLFKKPIEECTSHVHKVLEDGISSIFKVKLNSRRSLKAFIETKMDALLKKNFKVAQEFLEDRINAEEEYINYDDDDFTHLKQYIISDDDPEPEVLDVISKQYGVRSDLFVKSGCIEKINESIMEAQQKKSRKKKTTVRSTIQYSGASLGNRINDEWNIEKFVDIGKGLSNSDKDNIIYMKRVIHCYYCILKKAMKTETPKFIVSFLIKNTLNDISTTLLMALMKEKDKLALVSENEDTRKTREIATNSLNALDIAMSAIKVLKRGQCDIFPQDISEEDINEVEICDEEMSLED